MYAVAVTPLIRQLEDGNIKQVWYADDATAGGSLQVLRGWWDQMLDIGPAFGYYPNAAKTWLIVKEHHLEEAKIPFEDSGVSISTTEGKRHLGAAIGTPQFITAYIERKVDK